MQSNSVHVLPSGDLIEHEFDGCPCGPDEELVDADGGPDTYLIKHHSLDGRELAE